MGPTEKMIFDEVKMILCFWNYFSIQSCSFYSLNGENEVRVSRDRADSSASVGCFWGAENLDLCSDIEAKTNLVPTCNHLASSNSEGKRTSSVKAWVENFSSGEFSLIVHLHTITFLWLGAFLTSLKNLDTVFLGEILSKEGWGKNEDESKEDIGLHNMIRINYRFAILNI